MRPYLLLLFLSFAAALSAQHRYVGCVTDEVGDPLIGVTILLKGTTTGTVSDLDGCFDLICPDTTARLQISYTGYETATILAVAARSVNVRLEESEGVLDEVVVTGRAATRKRDLTRAVKSSKAKRRESAPPPPPPPPPPPAPKVMEAVTVKAYRVPLIEHDNTTSGSTVTKEAIKPIAEDARRSEELIVESAPVFMDASVDEKTIIEAAPGIMDASFAETRTSPDGTEPVVVDNAPAAGQLTAGESNDFSKWELWQDISQEDLAEFRSVWGFHPDRRFTVQLTFKGGIPAADVKVSLQNQAGDDVWAARTDNLGRAELWAGINDPQFSTAPLKLVAHAGGKAYSFTDNASMFGQNINSYELPTSCESLQAVDIAFVVDATGSMGDELRYLTSELGDVISRTREQLKTADLRTAAVFYRDSTDEYVTRHQAFTDDPARTVAYFDEQYHGGGGDHPEAVDAALQTAMDSLEWRASAITRLLFLVLDAPPHNDPKTVSRLQRLTQKAAREGIRLIPVVCSGMTKDGEYLLRSMALATNGTYVFLTDDSGIGGKHLAPTTDIYDVEKLNDLLVRVIVAFSKSNGCGSPVATKQKEEENEPKEALSFKAYPNPTSGPVNLKLPKGEGEIFVIDVTGKLLRRILITTRKTEVDLTGLAAGTYLLRYVVGEESGTRRMILTSA